MEKLSLVAATDFPPNDKAFVSSAVKLSKDTRQLSDGFVLFVKKEIVQYVLEIMIAVRITKTKPD